MEYTKEDLQRDAGIPHLPTDLTYELRMAVSGHKKDEFLSWGFQWTDKPHRLVYDACREIERQDAEIERLREENERLKEAAMIKEEFLPLEAYHTEEAAVEALDDLAREGQLCDLLDAKQQEIERLREDRERLQYALMKVCNSLDDNLPAIITKNIALAALGLPLRGMKEGE